MASKFLKRARYYQALCDSEALNKGESYRNLKEQYVIFICPDDIFKQGRAVYKFMNLEKGHSDHELGDLCFKNFYIFNKYKDVAEKSVKEYLEYFATNKANSQETKDIERERANAAERRANEAESRADEEKSRADKYEKMLKEHGLL